jgi:hypothetical protein
MTRHEYHGLIGAMTEAEYQQCEHDFGGGHQTVESRVAEFAVHPEYERRLCHLLKMPTEDERITEATQATARAAAESAHAAFESVRVARFSMYVAIVASVIAFLALIATLYRQ